MLKRKIHVSELIERAPIELKDSDKAIIQRSVKRLKSASPIAIESFLFGFGELLADYRHYQLSRSALSSQRIELSKLHKFEQKLSQLIALLDNLNNDPGIHLRLDISETSLFPVNYWDEINQNYITPRQLIAGRNNVDRPIDSLNSILDIVTVASRLRLPNQKPKGGRPTDLLRLNLAIKVADLYQLHFDTDAKATENFKNIIEIACRYTDINPSGLDDFVEKALSHRKRGIPV